MLVNSVSRHVFKRLKPTLWLVLMLFAVGCADDGMVEIAGQVTIDGTSVSQGTISFAPIDGQGATAEAVIENGKYSTSLPKGNKRVTVHGFAKVGERYPWGKDNPPADILKEIVPKDYHQDSQLSFDATVDDSGVNFDLSTK